MIAAVILLFVLVVLLLGVLVWRSLTVQAVVEDELRNQIAEERLTAMRKNRTETDDTTEKTHAEKQS